MLRKPFDSMRERWAVDVVMIVFVEEGRNLRKELGLL
jgi:hypothetical protein